ncbi:MAG: VOC family protein [Gammaproteobacteria bacterium]
MQDKLFSFHLAIPVFDLINCAIFYEKLFSCTRGRSSEDWIDLNFFNHQLVLHKAASSSKDSAINFVDGDNIPVPHFGVILDYNSFDKVATNARTQCIEFLIEPRLRFKGQAGEQMTMFFRDPSHNVIEIKAFKNRSDIFAA